ncbi:MAG: hypothetical protein HYX57_12635 [Chloroflexi bacterium]|nr:hypothetical protein [Chloroflexota bacterium]
MIETVVPADTRVSWDAARDHLAGCLLAEVWPARTAPDDAPMWEPYWAREQAGWLLIDALDRGVLTLDEVVTPNPVSTRPAYVSRVGAAVRRGLHTVAARFSRRPQPGGAPPFMGRPR